MVFYWIFQNEYHSQVLQHLFIYVQLSCVYNISTVVITLEGFCMFLRCIHHVES